MQILFGIVPLLFALELLLGLIMLPRFSRGECDFRHLYVSGYMVRTGQAHQLYDAQSQLRLQTELVSSAGGVALIRPAYIALLFAPFSLASFHSAYFSWLGVNLLLLILVASVIRYHGAEHGSWLVFFAFVPILIAILNGQDSVVLLVLLTVAFWALTAEREGLAGIFLALGLFKFQLVLPIALLFLLWRRWKVIGGFLLAGVALGAISFALVGAAGIHGLLHGLVAIQSLVHYRMMPNLHGFVAGICGENSRLVVPLTLALSFVLFVWAVLMRRASVGGSALLIAIPFAVVVSYYLNLHDASILSLPVAVLIHRRDWTAWAALAVFLAPAVVLFQLTLAYWMVVPFLVLGFASAYTGRTLQDAVTTIAGAGTAFSTATS